LFRFSLYVPRRSYLEDILTHKWKWCKEGIVNVQPFRELTKPLLDFGKRWYFVLGVLQLAFMTSFSTIYMPDWTQCSAGQCDFNATYPQRNEESGNLRWLWLVLPSAVLIYNGYMYAMSIFQQLYHTVSFLRSKFCHQHRRRSRKFGFFTCCLQATIERLPPCGFPVAILVWFWAYRHNGVDDPQYYQVVISA